MSPEERRRLEAWLTPEQLAVFDAMHPADRRHGLDVVRHLEADGHTDPELLLAGLLHDSAKGRQVRLPHRVAWSLGERYGTWVLRLSAPLPGFRRAFVRLERHADASADLAFRAGCSERTAELIRHQAAPRDPGAGEALRGADEAS